MLSSLIVIAILILFVILLYDTFGRSERLTHIIPGAKRLPVIGNTFHLLIHPVEIFKYMRKLYKYYGDIYQIHALNIRTIGIVDPELIEIILSSVRFHEKQLPYNFLKPWLNEGLLVSNGIKWHHRRKLLTEAFHFNILKKYFLTITEETGKFMTVVKEKSEENKTNLNTVISSATLHIMCETAMGSSIVGDKIESVASKYIKAINIMGLSVVERMCRVWLHIGFIFERSKLAKAQKEALEDLHVFTNRIIKNRRNFINENNINVFEGNENFGKKGRLAMLDLLLEKEKLGNIDNDGIREEVDTFMFEGHDTTAQALLFLLMTLANETMAQEAIYKEVQNIFGDSQRLPTMDDLNEMKYLECCIKESLRLYPSVPMIFRYIREEITLGGYTIPANSNIHIPIYDLHRREDIYPDPECFIPERFLPEKCVARHPYAYIPFSAGPRNCIGQKFAMMEMKTVVSSLLRRFRLEAVTKPCDLVFTADIILRTEQPVYVRFVKRELK